VGMTNREQFYAVLSGEKPDRPLVDLGGRVASMSKPAYLQLKTYLGMGDGLAEENVTLLNTIGRFDERILQHFQVPFRRLFLRPAAGFQLEVAEDGSFKDEWGVGYQPIDSYNERTGHPLAQAKLEDLEHYSWPDPNDPERTAGLADEARRLSETGCYCLAAGHISAGIFQDCWNLRGMARFMEDLALDPEFACALLDKVTAVHIGMWEQFLEAVGPYVDMVETADDLGGQLGPLVSPVMYRKIIKPYHAALNEAIRLFTKAPIFFHSCGAILPLIDDLVEIGVNILNPIQPLPGLMDPELLARRYGDRLVFHGGLDVQSLLIDGDSSQVRRHVQRYLRALSTNRYIMAPANTILVGAKPENIIAAFRAAAEYQE
jgi:uroporphyrinogen decarboxylase